MTRQAFHVEGVAPSSGPYSHVVAAQGELVVTAGQVAFDGLGNVSAGGIREQARQALRNLELCLEAAGCGLSDVLKVTAFLADLNDRSGYNEVYAGVFEPPYPARTTVEAGLPDGLLVEIEAIACRSSV